MIGRFRRKLALLGVLTTSLPLMAFQVHVVEQEVYGTITNIVADTIRDTSTTNLTVMPSAHTGYIFTEWSVDDANGLTQRDSFGRAYDNAPYQPLQDVILTANYLPESQDDDCDGVPDGLEIYWYGNLSQSAASDTDYDGYTFIQEIAAGTSPLMFDRAINGGVVLLDSDSWVYNPDGYPIVTLRSEPEGELFETVMKVANPGDIVDVSEVCDSFGNFSTFAYWALNGLRQADAFGRAVDTLSFTMPAYDVEIIAITAEKELDRLALYWYGCVAELVPSDSDGDGYMFAEEIAAGTNPLMPDRTLRHSVVHLDSDEWLYNPNRYSNYTIRSEPEGVLFDTETGIVAPGSAIITPSVSRDNGFAYWTLNGVRMTDDFGRALDSVKVVSDGFDVILVAHVVGNTVDQAKMYWYGSLDVDMESDTDHDGYTFAQELAAGTSPILPDRANKGGIVWLDSEEKEITLLLLVADNEGENLTSDDCNLIRQNAKLLFQGKMDEDSLAMKTVYENANKIKIAGPSGLVGIIADMGIAPAFAPTLDETGTLKLTYATPKLELTAFDPTTGEVRFKVTPGEGNQIVSEIATGYIHVYGTDNLGEKMRYVSSVGFDLTPYLNADTKGEGVLNITLGTHTFLKVKIESESRTEGDEE